jgi:Na+/melibiose symporter-like transporter
MPEAALVIVYVIFCLLVALCGTQRRIGFFGTFILSVIITPVIMLLVLILTAPPHRVERQRPPQGN